jgi:hypothetical protein
MKTSLQRMLKVVSLVVRQNLWFNVDGALANYREDVRQYVKQTNPGR